MQDLKTKPIDDLARIIARRLETLHMGGRLRDKTGAPVNSTGTGIPLSTIDREEIFLAARCGVICAKHREDDFLAQWRAASREARAALYRITKCPTFSTRAAAITGGERARERFEETLPEAEISERARLDFNPPDREEKPFAVLYRGARSALLEHWRHKTAFAHYNRIAKDFRASMELLSKLARDSRDGRFVLAHGRGRNKAEQNRIERLHQCVLHGRRILEISKPRDRAPRREAIGALAPRATGTAQAAKIIIIGGRASSRAPLTAFDWEATQAARDLAKNFPSIARKIAPRATRGEIESLAAHFHA
jgi:hypothetical protein